MLDFIGIGLGPFNLSLAALLQAKTPLQYRFFEVKAQFEWHAGMQLPQSVLQVPFMADLVSMVDPTSPFSFLNYLKHQQRLYKFYFLEQSHIARQEYNHYCQWVAQQLDTIQYQSEVVEIVPLQQGYRVSVRHQQQLKHYTCKNLVIGSGHCAYLPDCLNDIHAQYPRQCIHSAHYLNCKPEQFVGDVVVVGSGQSAAEIFQHLLQQQDAVCAKPTAAQLELHWFTRGKGFFPMEYTPLALEHFSPDYLKHFYHLDPAQKLQQLQGQALLHKGMSAQSIQQIYQALYYRSIAQQPLNAHLHSQCELVATEKLANQKIRLFFQSASVAQRFYIDTDYVIAATGYKAYVPTYMQKLKAVLLLDDAQRYQISFDYRLQHQANGDIFVQNQDVFSHGVGTPDLGLGAYRAAVIANQLADRKLYDIEHHTPQTFQDFGISQNPKIHCSNHHVSPTKSECLVDFVAQPDPSPCLTLAQSGSSTLQNASTKQVLHRQANSSANSQMNRSLNRQYEKLL